MPLDAIPHFDFNYESTSKGNLGGCCSKIKGDPKLFYNDRRNKLQFRNYEISCCSCYLGKRSEKAEQARAKKAYDGLDTWLQHHYKVELRDASEKAGVDVDQEITYTAFKAIHNQAIHERLYREYHVSLDDAKRDLGFDIYSDRTLSPLEEQRLENWAKQHNNKNKYDNVARKLSRQYGVLIEEAIRDLELKVDSEKGLSLEDVDAIENWAKMHNRNTDYDFVSHVTSVDLSPLKNLSGNLELVKAPQEPQESQDPEAQISEEQTQRMVNAVRALAIKAICTLTPRQILQAMGDRRGVDTQRTLDDPKIHDSPAKIDEDPNGKAEENQQDEIIVVE